MQLPKLTLLAEAVTAPHAEARVLTHASRMLMAGKGGVEPLLITLHEARLPGGAGGGGASRLANEGNVISLEATEVMEKLTAEVLHEAAHLAHDGTIGRALNVWVQSILEGASPAAMEYAAARLGRWSVAAERVSTGKFGYELGRPCPACGETDNDDTDEGNQGTGAVYIGLTLATCTRCGAYYTHAQILRIMATASQTHLAQEELQAA